MRSIAFAATMLTLALPGAALADMTEIRELGPAMAATIQGMVASIAGDDEFLLSDGTGEIVVHIGPNRMPVRPGELVEVAGAVDEDGSFEFYAARIVFGDGREVALPYRY